MSGCRGLEYQKEIPPPKPDLDHAPSTLASTTQCRLPPLNTGIPGAPVGVNSWEQKNWAAVVRTHIAPLSPSSYNSLRSRHGQKFEEEGARRDQA